MSFHIRFVGGAGKNENAAFHQSIASAKLLSNQQEIVEPTASNDKQAWYIAELEQRLKLIQHFAVPGKEALSNWIPKASRRASRRAFEIVSCGLAHKDDAPVRVLCSRVVRVSRGAAFSPCVPSGPCRFSAHANRARSAR